MSKEMSRASTFQWWDKVASSRVKEIPVEDFLAEQPLYQSEYMDCWNAIKSAGATLKNKRWHYKGRIFDNVKDCFDYVEMMSKS